MADEDTLAATPGEDTSIIETPVNDGIIDLDAPEPKVKETETDEDGNPKDAVPKAGDTEEPPKKPSGAQRAKIREARLLSELQARERENEELRRQLPAAKPASDTDAKPPREEDFNGDFFAYQRALTAFDAGRAASEAIDKQFKAREATERNSQQTEIARERSVAHLERVEDAREVIADFDQVMKKMDGVQARQDVIDEIMASDKSALLSYYLAKNPDKLSAMNTMSGRELAREMGRLEATVRLPEAKKQTTAPAPLSTPKGGAAPSSVESDLAKWLAKTYPK